MLSYQTLLLIFHYTIEYHNGKCSVDDRIYFIKDLDRKKFFKISLATALSK